ncbi:MAG TPA: TolC family protein [Bacteroidales bacterium]|nr:TolC family protein [Bacteroidales bacterium]
MVDTLSLSGFLKGVIKGNLGYIAEKFNVDIAEAELNAAKIFPDPDLSLSYSNNEERRLKMGQSMEAGINYQINTGNKRKAGINLARSQYEFSELFLESYFQNLRADAALCYFAGVKSREKYLLMVNMQKQVQELAYADSIRNAAGELSNLDALQSSLEARSVKAEVFKFYADMKNTLLNLMVLQGMKLTDSLIIPSDKMTFAIRDFNLPELLKSAIENRADLLAAIKNREISENNLKLLRAQRSFEFNLNAGYSYNTIVRNEIAPAPAYNGLTAGISVPLKFSDLNKGPVNAAELNVRKNMAIIDEYELQVRAAVIRSFNNYNALGQKAGHLNSGLIEDAEKILNGRILSYQRGETDLIGVINAQRTYIGLQLDYIDALYDFTSSLIELERAAGIWDISR